MRGVYEDTEGHSTVLMYAETANAASPSLITTSAAASAASSSSAACTCQAPLCFIIKVAYSSCRRTCGARVTTPSR